MRRSSIGPLPLTGGLQFNAPEGKPTGLLQALNVEPRDGFLATRRGQTHLGLQLNTVGGNVVRSFPANWNGATQTFLEINGTADDILRIIVTGPATAVENNNAAITYEFFGFDGLWHPMEVVNLTMVAVGNYWDTSAALAGALLEFVMPSGNSLGSVDPGSGAGQYMRITTTVAWTINTVLSAYGGVSNYKKGTFGRVFDIQSRDGARGPFAVLSRQFDASGTDQRWTLVDVNSVKTTPYGNRGDLVLGVVTERPSTTDRAVAVYIPTTDEALFTIGQSYVKADFKTASPTVTVFNPILPDPQLSAYGDIQTDQSLPAQPAFLCLFGKRVFAGGFASAKSQLRWSAPADQWTVWPSSNQTDLSGFGRGAILAGVPFRESLYIFTSNGIWRANLADPTDGNESDLFVDMVEPTPCLSGATVVACGNVICFLAPDGIRAFDGTRSRNISPGILDLFRPEAASPFAVNRPATASAAWHQIENQYRMTYAMPFSLMHDAMVVIDLDDRSAWIWGSDPPTDADYASATYQRPRGIRAAHVAWSSRHNAMLACDPENGLQLLDADGSDDLGSPIRWYAESQTFRIGRAEKSVLEKVTVEVQRQDFKQLTVSAIPDGDYSKADSRSIEPEPDRLDTSVAFGSASLAGSITPVNIDSSIVPAYGRFRSTGRNHRVRLQSTSPDHAPLMAMSVTVDLVADERSK